ncbi:MAG: D-alanyl-D-alanine carboxypeptidase/D-alanyl-D-alanine endopeptidase [Bryobacteraceae bacterium]
MIHRLGWLLIGLTAFGAAESLPDKIRTLLETSPVAQRGFVGVQIVDLESGETLFESGEKRYFVPASNTKLFTTALGLMRLGPDHRFHTMVVAAQPPDAEGRIAASITLVGAGDPNLSGRAIPYRVNGPPPEPLTAIEELAAQIVASGVKRIDGDVIGDDTAFLYEPFPDGWALNDPLWEYGAPVSALSVDDNTFTLTVRPGNPARVSLRPALDYFRIDNRVREGAARQVRIDREPGSNVLRIWGEMPAKDAGLSRSLAVDDPALYAAETLRDALVRRGVAIRGRAVARHFFPGDSPPAPPAGTELARRTSPPLLESLRVIDKVSQNLHAEMLLRSVGRARRQTGSMATGLAELHEFLTEAGIDPQEVRFRDGSGLSRMNLVTPAAIVRLLRYMYASAQREQWMALLPVGGEDGTLRLRMQNTAAARRIHAKTGSLAHVAALSGYANRAGGGTLGFSILTNNQAAPAGEARALIDRICVLMVE